MAFKERQVKDGLIRAMYACEGCGVDWYDLHKKSNDSPLDLHSSTTLHLVRIPGTEYFEVTSHPAGMKLMLGQSINQNSFLFYKEFGRDDDGFILCNKCHKLVHYLAEIESRKKIENKDRKNAIPSVMDLITVKYVLSGGVWRPN